MPPKQNENEVSVERFYAAVGKVAARWSSLEDTIQRAIWDLSGLSEREGACITSQIGSSSRLMDALYGLTSLRQGSEGKLKTIKKLIERTNALQRQRNRFVHDIWLFAKSRPGMALRLEFSPRIENVRAFREHNEKDIDELQTKIDDLDCEIFELALSVAPLKHKDDAFS